MRVASRRHFPTRARPRPSRVRVRVRVLGTPTVEVSGASAAIRPRAGELLALVAQRGRIDRSTAAALMWPDKSPADAANNLRVTLHFLVRAVAAHVPDGVVWLHTDERHLALAPGVAVDLHEFERSSLAGRRAEQRGQWRVALDHHRRALASYRGEFLAGVDADFAMFERLRLQTAATTVAASAARLARRHGDAADAVSFACRGVEIAPLVDEVAVELVLAMDAAGRPAEADLARHRHVTELVDAGLDPRPFVQVVSRARDPELAAAN